MTDWGLRITWVMERQPWRMAVATQSLLVSPAPTTTTSLSTASITGAERSSRARVANWR